MWKTGIYHVSQLTEPANLKGFFGKDKNVSITLYDQILKKDNASELAERILLLFSDERGAYKRTYSKRFEVFDDEVMRLVTAHWGAETELAVQDVGVSDARTAVDFFHKVVDAFSDCTFQASDYNPTVCVIERGKVKVTLSGQQKLLEIVYPPFVLNVNKADRLPFYPINRGIFWFLKRYVVPGLMADYAAGRISMRQLTLFAPEALVLAEQDRRFQLRQHDILKAFPMVGHVVRAMNILNLSYFTPDEFSLVLKNIHNGLHERGLFITGSNQDAGSVVHGGVYQKTAHGFQRLWSSGEGSPIHQRILEFSAH